MTIQAVFWDYDNTIIATAEAHWKKHQTVLAKHGLKLDERYRKKIYENNGNQNWEWISKELGLKVPEKEYLVEIDSEFQKHMFVLELRPGVAELFKMFSNLGIPQAIVTNARKDSAKPVLDEKKITSLMKFVLYKEDYEGRKPDPTPYLRGFERMAALLQQNIEPNRCLVIEDDPNGVKSAHSAGAIVIQRKLAEEEGVCSEADYSCYHQDDLIRIVTHLIHK